jgi:hypothetical protein
VDGQCPRWGTEGGGANRSGSPLLNSTMIAALQDAVKNAFIDFGRLALALLNVLNRGAWRRFHLPTLPSAEVTPAESAETEVSYAPDQFEAFCAAAPPRGLGVPVERLMRLIEAVAGRDADAAVRHIRALLQPLEQHGGDGGEGAATDKVVALPRRSRGSAYNLKRLKRDQPELANDVIAGRISPNAAAEAAGIRRRTVHFPADPQRAAKKFRAMGKEWRRNFLTAVGVGTEEDRVDNQPAKLSVSGGDARTDQGQIELCLSDRENRFPVVLRLPGAWIVPPEDAMFMPLSDAADLARVSVAGLAGGALLALIRARRRGDGYPTTALLCGDPGELGSLPLPTALIDGIQALIRRPADAPQPESTEPEQ